MHRYPFGEKVLEHPTAQKLTTFGIKSRRVKTIITLLFSSLATGWLAYLLLHYNMNIIGGILALIIAIFGSTALLSAFRRPVHKIHPSLNRSIDVGFGIAVLSTLYGIIHFIFILPHDYLGMFTAFIMIAFAVTQVFVFIMIVIRTIKNK